MVYILLFILLLLAQLLYSWIADHFNIIDKPNERSSHTSITLRGGGIVFYIGVLLYFLMQGFQYPWLMAGLTLIAVISFADDVKPQSSKLRLVVHLVAMSLMFNQLGIYHLPWYFTVMVLIFCTGVLNAYNFMDGINGITGGYSVVAIASFWYINTFQTAFVDNKLLYALMMALMVFNFFNFRKKAKCFAGDVGAISIAFVVVFLMVALIIATNDFSYIALLGLYGVDSILTIVHRILLQENIFEPHRKHLYQLLANELQWPHVAVSGLYAGVQVLISLGLVLTSHKGVYAIGVIMFFSGVYVWFMKKYFKLHKASLQK
jgi:UDP-N-acetylmuramyl pentapeptide phosphotransferase/UDP-N-acetylglucosamine-1-phosphate transferase